MARADLHIHSRYSNRPTEWILRRLTMLDSYSEPRTLFSDLKKRGMDFVTLTDHDSIEGCLRLAEMRETFISEQVTAVFPEDRCQVHLLVWGITEEQHRQIQELRFDIYDLQQFLADQNLAHAVAHPLFPTDEKFGPAHIQKLILLFKHFEEINGYRDTAFSETARFILSSLDAKKIEQMANRHNLSPRQEKPWEKIYTGGSDDHSGVFPAQAYTETPAAADVNEFLTHIKNGRCSAKGKGGTPLALSHGLYRTFFSFAQEKFQRGPRASGAGLVEKAFSRFMEGKDPTEFSWHEKLAFLSQSILTGKIFELAKPANASLWRQLSTYFNQSDIRSSLAKQTADIPEAERRAFIIANLFANQLAFRFFTQLVKDVSSGNLVESLQHISALIPVLLPLTPYIYAFQSQTPRHLRIRTFCNEVAGSLPPWLRNEKRAWFTDTLEDVNGVANTIRKMTAAGVGLGREIIVVTSRAQIQASDIPIQNFPPIGEFELPEYELQKLSFPPVLQMLDYIQRERFTEVIISTPGPVGLTALLAARMLGLRTSGIYHTDFPQYVRILTDDSFMETLTWNYMHWFYSQLDLVYVNSAHYRDRWIERGIPSERVAILPRGLDTSLFHPARRNETLRKNWKLRTGEIALLYVGRISREKDLDVLANAYRNLRSGKNGVRLVLVGDGPYMNELKQMIPDAFFTGYLSGERLAEAFASADIFAFPSTTDTFGNVILEAMASGLPCVVSDVGGPRELVKEGKNGFITRARDSNHFAEAVRRIAEDSQLRMSMGEAAHLSVSSRDWSNAFEQFWNRSCDNHTASGIMPAQN